MNDLTLLVTTTSICVIIAYLLGSIPAAFILSKRKGIDIFKVGTRSAGTSNVFRSIGKARGVLVMTIDILKGALAVAIPIYFNLPDALTLLSAYAAILGHWHSVFTKFQGGDGMASMIGIIFMLVPSIAVISMLLGIIFILMCSRMHSRTSIGLFVCTIAILVLGRSGVYPGTITIGLSFLSLSIIIHALYKKVKIQKSLSLEVPIESITEY